jgi:uncharacterized protein YkwD
VDHDHEPVSSRLIIAGISRTSRRRLLAMLAAVPAALGLAHFAEPDADAKKGKHKHKNKKKKRKKGGKKGGGGGGGGYSPDSEERAFLDLINDYRDKNGAGKLSLNNQLGAAAEHHSQDMAKKNYFSHKLSNGDSAEENIKRFGYTNYDFVGENIAAGHETASKVFEQWKKSSDHDKNMRSKDFDEIGIGRAHAQKSKYGWYWTTTFGSR